jgi:hypothetical protein
MNEQCLWCGKPAVALCDAWIGGETVIEDGVPRFSMRGQNFTCDAPMCGDHRHHRGFICGEAADTIDWCPAHHKDKVTLHNAAKSAVEAESHRRAAWAEGRRHRMRTAQT